MMEEFHSLACRAPRKQRTLAVSEQLQAAEGAQLPAAAVTSADMGAPPSVTFPSPWSRWERNGFVHNLQSAFLYFYIFFKSFLFTEKWCIDWKVRFPFLMSKNGEVRKGKTWWAQAQAAPVRWIFAVTVSLNYHRADVNGVIYSVW